MENDDKKRVKGKRKINLRGKKSHEILKSSVLAGVLPGPRRQRRGGKNGARTKNK